MFKKARVEPVATRAEALEAQVREIVAAQTTLTVWLDGLRNEREEVSRGVLADPTAAAKRLAEIDAWLNAGCQIHDLLEGRRREALGNLRAYSRWEQSPHGGRAVPPTP